MDLAYTLGKSKRTMQTSLFEYTLLSHYQRCQNSLRLKCLLLPLTTNDSQTMVRPVFIMLLLEIVRISSFEELRFHWLAGTEDSFLGIVESLVEIMGGLSLIEI